MYSDGDRKTVSELQREAEATRSKIVQEACALERIHKNTAKVHSSIDQLFRLFAREATTDEERNALITILKSKPEVVHLDGVPLLPVAVAMANGKLMPTRSIVAVANRTVTDFTVIFLAHVLRFSPHTLHVRSLDISETAVSRKGIVFLLEAIADRNREFSLTAVRLKGAVLQPPGYPEDLITTEEYKDRFAAAVKRLRQMKDVEMFLDSFEP